MPSATMNGSKASDGAEDDIVLTGISGRLPDCDSIEEFAQKLFDGIDLVSDDDRRWQPGLHGLPARSGKLKDLKHFDATFFGVHAKQAHLMDPQLRLLLETTHEAMVDAGFAPAEFRGSRTGVYVGVSNSESEEMWTRDADKINGYALTGCCRAMFPNRISYTFDLKGPSYAVDTACSSSLFALAQAVAALRSGQCDAAVVAGANLCLKPGNSLNFHRLSMLSPDGRCAAFDASGRGYVRSEAVVSLILQRRKHARRVYAVVRNARMNTDGTKDQGITYPSGAMQRALAEETFREVGLRPQDVVYVEAHGTGTKVGDPQEVNAIADLFCAGRSTPLLLGSVKSNMGHSEPASGLCSMAKLVVAMQRGVIPANLHYKTPNPDIPALSDGRIKVVDRNMPWDGGLIAVNSFGFGGANAHVILEVSREGREAVTSPVEVPRLVLGSGRSEEAAAEMLRAARHADARLHALLDAVHATPTPGHTHRGFALLPPAGADASDYFEEIAETDGVSRPVWWVFSGMGSQWAGMARPLLALPVFAASLARSAAALKQHGVDLMHILTDAPDTAFEDVVNSFVSIASVQVALVEVLRAAGIKPDGFIGHSVGEIGCAFADDTLTAEQAVLAAYWRGRSIVDSKLAPGAMAAVGLSWEECGRRCPPGVVPACHNAADSVTVSGPVAAIEQFVEQLSAEGVFARRVNSSGVAFHSKYIAPAGPTLRRSLEKIIRNPKPRSHRWVSSSLAPDQRDTDLAKMSDVSYHVNNLLSPVRFADALAAVPTDALIIEVAPHALLQAVLRRARPHPAAIVPLIRKDQPHVLRQLLAALGRVYINGGQPKPAALYPRVPFPVSRRTPTLASSVRWDHSIEWAVADFSSASHSGENVIEVDLSKPEDAFYAGHEIDGRILFPATGYLVLVWRTVAKLRNKNFEEMPIVMENVAFKRATIVNRDTPLRFLVNVLEGTGEFEVCEGGAPVVTGRARVPELPDRERLNLDQEPEPKAEPGEVPLGSEDVYKELRLRGYNYGGIFRGITHAECGGARGTLAWHNNWVSFMDTVLQFALVGADTRLLQLPTRVERVTLDPARHAATLSDGAFAVRSLPALRIIAAGGCEVRGLKVSLAPRRLNAQAPPKLERYSFRPYDEAAVAADDATRSRRDALVVCLQLALENCGAMRLKILEAALERPAEALLLPTSLELLDSEPAVRVDASLAAGANVASYEALTELGVKITPKDARSGPPDTGCHLVMGADILARHDAAALAQLAASLAEGGMLLLEEPRRAAEDAVAVDVIRRAGLILVARQVAASREYLLLRQDTPPPTEYVAIEAPADGSYAWVPALRDALQRATNETMRVYVWAREEDAGVLGLANCLRAEPGGRALRVYHVPGGAPFKPDAPQYAAQVRRDLVVNVLRGGVWGCMRHLPLGAAEAQLQLEHAFVNTLARGDLSSLRWIESPLRHAPEPPEPGTELCRVYCAPLNFRDIMLATGKLPPDALPGSLAGQDCILGLEFSGRGSDGRRVMGMVAARGLATSVLADTQFLWDVPKAWTLEEAATVPVAYATAYYALQVRGRMAKGEAVLIHAGSGGVGQAAIAIALHAGCKVFTTVGTPDKIAFLRSRFPTLPPENIGNSRDCSFEQLVLRRTNGRGVDLVLNSLADDKLLASVRCLAEGGRFLEIGKLDLSNNTPLGMAIFLKNTTFHGILLDALFEAGSQSADKAAVVACMREGLANGAIRPLPSTVFADHQLEQAFRYMATGKHIGKVVVRVREEEAAGGNARARRLVAALPRTYMHPDRSYVLVGGLGGFGLELCWWLISRGARKLVIVSRGGVRGGYQAWCVSRWRRAGVAVSLPTTDVSTPDGARALLRDAAKLGPVAGVFNLAGVLRDAFIDNQTPEDFKMVAKPKVDATRALDIATRELAPELEYFVAFSSVSCGRGNAGQSNYGLANSVMERVCERRQADGLPALAVQWGAIGEVGMLVDQLGGSGGAEQEVGGTVPQRIGSCVEALGALLALPHAVAASMVPADKRRRAPAPAHGLDHVVANVLGIKDVSKVSDTANLAELGMDSLMGAEIKQTLERNYDVVLAVQDIRALTFAKLREMSGGAGAGEAKGEAEAGRGEDTLVQMAAMGELIPTQVLVTLPSQPGANTVFMVHPIEGVADPLRGLAAGVRGTALGLQCVRAAPLQDMASLARFYLSHVRAAQPRPPYTLLGYSFGAGVAFEMALQLEQEGFPSRLVLVDGSPAYLTTHTTRGKKKSQAPSAATNEANALAYFVQQFTDIDVAKVASELEQLAGWKERVSRATALAAAGGRHPADTLAAAADAFYRKLVIADAYRPARKLNAPVVLFRASDNYVTLDDDYGLRAVCSGPLDSRQLHGNHRSILAGDAARAISDCLSELLEKH